MTALASLHSRAREHGILAQEHESNMVKPAGEFYSRPHLHSHRHSIKIRMQHHGRFQ